ncbi:MAG TPA: hypothetical protein VEY91_06110 [Candidatus Limnocylindria bacterium]|nr:hypothetical protein [Candidatus Limnocylindria bacterium]
MRTATLYRPWFLLLGALVVLAAIAWSTSPRSAATEGANPPDVAVAQAVETPATPAPVASAPAAKPKSRPSEARRAPVQSNAAPVIAATEAGMRAYINSETGELGAPSELQRRIPATVPLHDHSLEQFEVQRLPDGSLMVDTKGLLEEYAIMKIGPDGKRILTCVSHPHATLPSAVAPASAPVEE